MSKIELTINCKCNNKILLTVVPPYRFNIKCVLCGELYVGKLDRN